MHVKHGPEQKVITADWQYLKEKYIETFLAKYRIQNKEHLKEGKVTTYTDHMENPIFYHT